MPLEQIARFLARVGEAIQRRLEQHPACAFLGETEVVRLDLEAGSVVATLRDLRTDETTHTRAAAVSLGVGGRQDLQAALAAELPGGLRLGDLPGLPVRLTDELLTEAGLAEAHARLAEAERPRVAILGSSHSAFSAAWALLECCRDLDLPDGALRLLHREPPLVYYPS